MQQIITKHKNRYKVFRALPIHNTHPYFPPQKLSKSAHYTCQNMVIRIPSLTLISCVFWGKLFCLLKL